MQDNYWVQFVDYADGNLKDEITKLQDAEDLRLQKIIDASKEDIKLPTETSQPQASIGEELENELDEAVITANKFVIDKTDLDDFNSANFPLDADADLTDVISEYLMYTYHTEVEAFTFDYDEASNSYIVYVM